MLTLVLCTQQGIVHLLGSDGTVWGATKDVQFLRRKIEASAQRVEVREGMEARNVLSLVNLIYAFC